MNSADREKENAKNLSLQLPKIGAVTSIAQTEELSHDLQKRATVISPVLEEILQPHWEHWGLNDYIGFRE
jgi:hypothetical protein